jgi:hypothetical protein
LDIIIKKNVKETYDDLIEQDGIGNNIPCQFIKYNEKPRDQWRILITGLHACGDLSSLTIPAIFETNPQFISAIYIGCCYQRISY